MTFSAAVLAGGRSRRMGRDKAWIEVDGEPMVVRIVRRLEQTSDDVFVVAKDVSRFEASGLRAVADATDEQTPLAGIAAALRDPHHDLVFVCACDMPDVDPDLVRSLAERCVGVDAVVPVRDGVLQPMHAVWTRSASDVVDAALAAGERAPKRVLQQLRTLEVPLESASLDDRDTIGLS